MARSLAVSRSVPRRLLAAVAAGALVVALAALAPASDAGATAGAALACSISGPADFNGDTFDDAVVADPRATVGGDALAGRVVVLYGNADGELGAGGVTVISQDSPGLGYEGENAEPGDLFGTAVAVADVDDDGCQDLVVGAPGENMFGLADTGLVHVVYGAVGGVDDGQAADSFNQGAAGGDGTEAGDQFGSSLAVGQARGADDAVIAIGAPGEDDEATGRKDTGLVSLALVADGFGDGVSYTQDSPGVEGAAEAGDRFGASVAVGAIAGTAGRWDVVAGAPGEDIAGKADAGSVTVLRDVATGSGTGTAWAQDRPGVPGTVETGDRFGAAVDAVGAGSGTRIAVGVPGEGIGSATGAGLVQLFSSSGSGMTAGTALSQDTAGVSGVAEAGDGFGTSLSLKGISVGEDDPRLAVGVPYEDVGNDANAGSVQVFPVLDLDGETSYDQGRPDVPGASEPTDRFGLSVAWVAGGQVPLVLAGVPYDTDYASGMVDVLPLGGSPYALVPGERGVPTSGAVAFGRQVGGGRNQG